MFYDVFVCLLKNIKYGSLTVEYNVLFEQCSYVIFTEDFHYRGPIVDQGKETHVDAQANGDAGNMVQLIRCKRFILQDSLSTQVYLEMLFICTDAIYLIAINDGSKYSCTCCMCNLPYNFEQSVPKAKHCPD